MLQGKYRYPILLLLSGVLFSCLILWRELLVVCGFFVVVAVSFLIYSLFHLVSFVLWFTYSSAVCENLKTTSNLVPPLPLWLQSPVLSNLYIHRAEDKRCFQKKGT